ncbi:hypothetical protein PH5382_03863 [Phaeobacter sp. CECT 5382]|uniref:hypothetical protein n=1 Tax=Phaeobacter sp. CECT 5382 TaxID=1712645 RepID=UPI0006DA4290|nr:hypothetical protein [Phaeobacter sp. CECT 5382]CUH89908.1 hypothetical protein PH5382_03863 [Phaeobacter sp. CECT 5382]
MVKTRICGSCKKPTLIPVSRKREPYNTVVGYLCQNCGRKIDIVPAFSVGSGLAIAWAVLGFWYFVFFHNSVYNSTLSISLYAGAVVTVVLVWGPECLRHWMNPVAKGGDAVEVKLEKEGRGSVTSALIWCERFGFFGGLIAPVVFASVFLGAAAILGLINYTYFQ